MQKIISIEKKLIKTLLLTILLSALLNLLTFSESRKSKAHLYKEAEFPELTEEEIVRAKSLYMTEEDIDQKGFLEPIIHPERFDLNMDEKISKAELKKAINWMIYSKDPVQMKKMKLILTSHVANAIEVFLNDLDFESFSYLQFGKFMNRINAPEFINEEIMMNRHIIDGSKHREPAVDL